MYIWKEREANLTQKKKQKSNHKGWIWKTISIKKKDKNKLK